MHHLAIGCGEEEGQRYGGFSVGCGWGSRRWGWWGGGRSVWRGVEGVDADSSFYYYRGFGRCMISHNLGTDVVCTMLLCYVYNRLL
jgi:hypothetical protein